jgi:hypothetical protein
MKKAAALTLLLPDVMLRQVVAVVLRMLMTGQAPF